MMVETIECPSNSKFSLKTNLGTFSLSENVEASIIVNCPNGLKKKEFS